MLTLYLVVYVGNSILYNIYESKIEKQIKKDLEEFAKMQQEMTKDWK